MNFFRSIFFILIAFFCINIFFAYAQSPVDQSVKIEEDMKSKPITRESIKAFIKNKTPEYVSTPINKSIDWLEKERINLGNVSNEKQKSLREGIVREEASIKSNILDGETKINLEPWQRVELYFFIIASYIFAHQILFYIIPLILFYILIKSLIRLFR